MTARPRIPPAWAAVSALALALLAVSASLGATVYGVPPVVSIVVALLHSAGLLLGGPVPRARRRRRGRRCRLGAERARGDGRRTVAGPGRHHDRFRRDPRHRRACRASGSFPRRHHAAPLAVTLARGQRLAVGPVIADLIVFVALAGLAT